MPKCCSPISASPEALSRTRRNFSLAAVWNPRGCRAAASDRRRAIDRTLGSAGCDTRRPPRCHAAPFDFSARNRREAVDAALLFSTPLARSGPLQDDVGAEVRRRTRAAGAPHQGAWRGSIDAQARRDRARQENADEIGRWRTSD